MRKQKLVGGPKSQWGLPIGGDTGADHQKGYPTSEGGQVVWTLLNSDTRRKWTYSSQLSKDVGAFFGAYSGGLLRRGSQGPSLPDQKGPVTSDAKQTTGPGNGIGGTSTSIKFGKGRKKEDQITRRAKATQKDPYSKTHIKLKKSNKNTRRHYRSELFLRTKHNPSLKGNDSEAGVKYLCAIERHHVKAKVPIQVL